MRKNMLKIAIAVILFLAVVTLILVNVLKDKPGEMMSEAYELRIQEKSEEAALLFGKIAIMYPTSKHADKAYFEEGFERFVILYPKTRAEEKGVLLNLSSKAFNKVINDYPQSEFITESRKHLANICIEKGDSEQAVEHLQAVIASTEDPEEWQEVYSHVANTYDGRKEYSEAASYYRKVIEVNLPGRHFENAHLKLAEYYQIVALEGGGNSAESFQRIIDLLTGLLAAENNVSPETELRALLSYMIFSHLELGNLEQAEEIISLLESRQISPSARNLLTEYKMRIARLRNLGR